MEDRFILWSSLWRYYRRVLEYIKHDLRLLNPKSECREAMDGTVTVASQSYSGSAR